MKKATGSDSKLMSHARISPVGVGQPLDRLSEPLHHLQCLMMNGHSQQPDFWRNTKVKIEFWERFRSGSGPDMATEPALFVTK